MPGKDLIYVGSIKTVLGHTEGTAGIAALVKAAAAVEHALIPPNLLFQCLNPAIEPFYHGLRVPVVATPWPQLPSGQPRRASVNSFGFGVANAHVIVESFERQIKETLEDDGVVFGPYVFSAGSEQSLAANLKAFADYLGQEKVSAVNQADLAWTLRHRRYILSFKIAFPACVSLLKLRASIEASIREYRTQKTPLGIRSSNSPQQTRRVLGIFTGQGAQYARMGASLVEQSPFARRVFEDLEGHLAQLPAADRPDWSLIKELLADAKSSRLGEASLSQPLCTAIQIVLVNLLRQAAIEFAGVLGHSSGEIGAAYAAGYVSERDAICIAQYRGLHSRLAASPKGPQVKGAMLAVGTSFEDAAELLSGPEFEGRVTVAASNSSASVTLSGDEDAIDELEVIFEDEKKFRRRLKVDKAYHSAHMLPCVDPYVRSLNGSGVGAEPTRPAETVWTLPSSKIWRWTPRRQQRNCMTQRTGPTIWSDRFFSPVGFRKLSQRTTSSSSSRLVRIRL